MSQQNLTPESGGGKEMDVVDGRLGPRTDNPQAPGAPAWAARLRAYRLARGLTQAALAERSGVDAETVRRYDRGEKARPSLAVALRLAEALGVWVEDIWHTGEE